MTTTAIQSFPARKLDAARHALELAHKRLTRSAERAGQPAPAAPTLTVTRERVESVCTECKVIAEGFFGSCLACKRGHMISRKVLDLEITCERPRLAGWDFLGVVEPLEGGNLIRQVPGAIVAEGELSPWAKGTVTCDHCKVARRRLETFIVRADGSDPTISAGTYKQVGRNCLEAFLGGKSAAAIVASLAWPSLVSAAGDEDEGSWMSSGRNVYQPIEFMTWVASVVRIAGWVSKGQARDREDGPRPTADIVQYLLTPPFSPMGRSEWEKAREEFRPDEDDAARGKAALTWAADLAGHTDYERNLSLVARQSCLEPSHAGILASAVAAHARMLGEQVKREARSANPSAHLGAVGDKKRDFGRVVVERINAVETNYGPLHIHTFRDSSGNAIVWRTGEAHGAAGESFVLVGTVKAHSEFRGEKQTEVTRCKMVAA